MMEAGLNGIQLLSFASSQDEEQLLILLRLLLLFYFLDRSYIALTLLVAPRKGQAGTSACSAFLIRIVLTPRRHQTEEESR